MCAVRRDSSALSNASLAVIESLERRTLLSAGDVLHTEFTDVAGHSDSGGAVVALGDNKLLQVGLSFDGNFNAVFSLARFNADGTPDTSFGAAGSSVVLDALPDASYTLGAVNAAAVDGTGRLIVVGRADKGVGSHFFVAAFDPDGQLDSGFGSGGVTIADFSSLPNEARALAIGGDGTIFVAGGSTHLDQNLFDLARLTSDGQLDSEFGVNGIAESPLLTVGDSSIDIVHAMAIDSGGNIILAGSSLASFNGEIGTVIGLQRYGADGTLDATFGAGGSVRLDVAAPDVTALGDKAYSVVVDQTGGILVGGTTDGPIANSDTFVLLRFNSDGSQDLSFGGTTDGAVRTYFGGLTSALISDMAIQSDGAILAGGNILTCNDELCGEGSNTFALARYDATGRLDGNFGGGGVVLTQHFVGQRPENNLATLALQPDANGNPTLALGSWINADMPVEGPPLNPSDDLVLVRFALSGASVDLSGPATANEGDAVHFTANFSGALANGINFMQAQHRAQGTAASRPDTTVDYDWTITLDKQTTAAAHGSGTATNSLDIPFTPADNGLYHVVISINGGADTANFDIDVKNVAPVPTITNAPAGGLEGSAITLGSSVSDPGSADTFSYAWSVTKNGVAYTSGTDVTFSFTPDDNGVYVVSLKVTDDDLDAGSDSHSITVANVAPTATIKGAPTSSAEGRGITLTSTVSDPGPLDTTFSYAWSVTKAGKAFAAGSASDFSFTPDDNGDYVVTLNVTDKDGGVGTDSQTIAVTNVAPTAAISGAPASSPEGAGISLNSTVSDPGSADTFTYAWSVSKSGSPFASGSGSDFSFTPDDNGSYVVTLTVTDDDGGVGTDSRAISVSNVAPTATINGAPATGLEGSAITLTGSASDPGSADTLTLSWSVTKNGSFYASGTGASFSFTPNDNGSYVLTLTATDDDGGVGSDSRTITISNVPPTVSPISGPNSGQQGAVQTFTSAFTDPGSADTWIVTWNFGDGTSQTTSSPPGAISASHTYLAAGNYAVSVTVTDDDGGSATQSSSITIASTDTGTLRIQGTAGDDKITVKVACDGALSVEVNGTAKTYSGITRIVIDAGAGDDRVKINPEVTQPAIVFAGDGDDSVKGGSGDDIIVGGGGDDLLHGDDGRDLVIGGFGEDRIVGNADSDILVASYSIYDGDAGALGAIMAEWTSARTFGQRTANVMGRDVMVNGVLYVFGGPRNNGNIFLTPNGPSATVFDDNQVDILTGSAGRDLFLFNGDTGVVDVLTGLTSDELAADVDFLSEV